MSRFLTIFGALFATAGTLAGALFLNTRYAAYMEAIRLGRVMIAPLMWQVSLGAGVLVITLSLLFGFLLFMLGRTLARVARLERTLGEDPAPTGELELAGGNAAADGPAVVAQG